MAAVNLVMWSLGLRYLLTCISKCEQHLPTSAFVVGPKKDSNLVCICFHPKEFTVLTKRGAFVSRKGISRLYEECFSALKRVSAENLFRGFTPRAHILIEFVVSHFKH